MKIEIIMNIFITAVKILNIACTNHKIYKLTVHRIKSKVKTSCRTTSLNVGRLVFKHPLSQTDPICNFKVRKQNSICTIFAWI